MDVDIRHEGGVIHLGRRFAAPAQEESIPLRGAIAHVDPTAVGLPVPLTITDADEAYDVLVRLYGHAVADAVSRVHPEGPTATAEVSTTGWRAVERLGLLLWLRRLSPLPLDPSALHLEIMAGVVACADLMDPDDLGPDDPCEHTDALLETARFLRSTSDPSPDRDTVGDLLDVVLRHVADDPRTPGDVALGAWHEVDLLEIDRTWAQGATRPPTTPTWAMDLSPVGATAAGTTSPSTTRRQGTDSLDWDRVPARLLDPAEGSITWIARSGEGSAGVAVVVRSAPSPSLHPMLRALRPPPVVADLRFRVYVPGLPFPAAEAGLARRADWDAWSGSVLLGRGAASALHRSPDLWVDVHTAGYPLPPKQGSAAVEAEAQRWTVRALAALRMAAAIPPTGEMDLRSSAAMSLARARTLWAAAEENSPEALACAHLHRAVRRDPSMPAGSEGPPLPDLTDSAWAPCWTERLLARGGAA